MRFGLRETIFTLLLLAVPVAVYFFAFKPRNALISVARTEIGLKQQKLKQLDTEMRIVPDFGKEIDKLARAVQLAEAKLPSQREIDKILKQVSDLAARHNLVVKSIRTDKPVAAAQYSEQPIPMVILGEFDGFYSFLLDLERLSRITRMPKMKLKRLENNPQGAVQFDVTLSVFFDPNDSGFDRSAGKDRL